MARGQLSVESRDQGLGYTGPGGPTTLAAIGVASAAVAIADQAVVGVTNADDAETLVGIGPLRDMLVTILNRSGGLVLAMPLARSAGGTPIGAGTALIDGELTVTPLDTGWALGNQRVIIECITGGAPPAAGFRLIVDGIPLLPFSPTAAEVTAASYSVPAGSLGSLATGVATTDTLKINLEITTGTDFTAGDRVAWTMSLTRPAGADMAPSIEKIRNHREIWEGVFTASYITPATAALLDTAVRELEAQGRFVFAVGQLAGPTLATGATTAVATPSWVSTAIAGYSGMPVRAMSPRSQFALPWASMRDPANRNLNKEWPMTYAYAAHLASLSPWQPPDATLTGPLPGVLGIIPADMSGPQIDALDNAWYVTMQTHQGRPGTYLTHGRMWGVPPGLGVYGSDYNGIERRRVMDEACRRVYNALFPRLNSPVATNAQGRISESEKAQWAGEALRGLRTLLDEGAITFAQVVVSDKAPGVLVTDTVLVTVRITPLGKASNIQTTVGFFVAEAASAEEVA